VAALEVMAAVRPEAVTPHVERLLRSGTTLEKQKCCAVLAAAKTDAADEVLRRELEDLIAGKCPPTRQLDVLEAVKTRAADSAALAEMLAAYEASRAALAATPAGFAECLEGGDAAAGKEIVNTHLAANCIACHRFDTKEGSEVGPALSAIGAQKDRVYLLESLVSPTAVIPPGYGIVVVSMRDGSSVSGALVARDDAEVTLRLADGKEQKLEMAEVKSMSEPVSVMPPMSALLTRRELRDVVAYLAGLKGGSSGKKN
jgi:putative heme-binding domain-containing protein